jgi:outer membrane protein assembly factor BamE (lipoprotein component of BamABCDE complex)
MISPPARTLLCSTLLVLLVGCQSKFTRDRFDMVRAGVDNREDVRKILGNPKSDLEDQWFYDDLDNHYSAVIHFDSAGRVKAKEWMDARTGTWEGRNPNTDPPPASGEEREKRTKTTRVDKD